MSAIKSSSGTRPQFAAGQPQNTGTILLPAYAFLSPATISSGVSSPSSMNFTSKSSSPSAAAPARTPTAVFTFSANSAGTAEAFSTSPCAGTKYALLCSTSMTPLHEAPSPIGMVTGQISTLNCAWIFFETADMSDFSSSI